MQSDEEDVGGSRLWSKRGARGSARHSPRPGSRAGSGTDSRPETPPVASCEGSESAAGAAGATTKPQLEPPTLFEGTVTPQVDLSSQDDLLERPPRPSKARDP